MIEEILNNLLMINELLSIEEEIEERKILLNVKEALYDKLEKVIIYPYKEKVDDKNEM